MILTLQYLLYAILAAFAARTISHMFMYAFGYGQFLGWLKLRVARKVDAGLVDMVMSGIHSVTEGQERTPDMYDILCNKPGGWAWLLSIMDCPFCFGFYVSLSVAIGVVLVFSLHWILVLAIPVLTFFFIEKI